MPKLRHRQTIELQMFQSVYPRRGVDILTHNRITDRCLRSLSAGHPPNISDAHRVVSAGHAFAWSSIGDLGFD